MPRYFFHLYNSIEALDEEGIEYSDMEEVKAEAVVGIRELVAEEIRRNGSMTLSHRVEVENENGDRVLVVHFRDALSINP